GRKRGMAGVIATQRLAKLAKNVAAEASNFLKGRTFLDIDMARAADLLGMDERQAEQFRDLERGRFVGLGPAISRRPLPVAIGPVETSARSVSPKLMPMPETTSEDAAELIFKVDPEEERRMVRRPPPPPPAPTAEILERLTRQRAEPAAAEPAPTLFPEVDEAEREAALNAVLRAIVDDPDASFRSVAVLYQDFLVRCRIHRVPGAAPDLNNFKRRLAIARAGVDGKTAEGKEWHQALAMADTLTDDIR